jgi:3-hydroxypropanoate dehydrogenase
MSAAENTPARAKISTEAANQIFGEARTYRAWRPERVPEAVLRELYELAEMGPTSGNSLPGRFVFLTTDNAKARLLPALDPGNVEKTRHAPVVAIVAYDMEFVEKAREVAKNPGALGWLIGKPAAIEETAFRNGSLQGGYLILAARAVGLDCGPMSGFNAQKVNEEFFPDGKWKVNFICNLGYGDRTNMPPRAARIPFEEACRVL